MGTFDEEIDLLRATVVLTQTMGIQISSKNGSTIVVQADEASGQFFAALAVRIEYAASPEEALSNMTASLRELIDARKKEVEGVLPQAGQEKPR